LNGPSYDIVVTPLEWKAQYPAASLRARSALQWPMPVLTRKRVNDRPERWHVHYAGVRVGMILERSGVANTAEPREWHCGFYPGSEPGEQRYGRAASFEAARAAFEAAWREYLPRRSEADFQAWRDQEAWTERKYALWDAGKKLEPPSYGPGKPAHTFRKCPCGEIFDMHGPEEVLKHVPHITAAEAVQAR